MRIVVLLKNKSQEEENKYTMNTTIVIKRGVQNTERILQVYKENEDILIGTLLGDASMQTYSDGKTWRLRCIQKDEQYLRHLYKLWEEFTGTEPKSIKDKQGSELWYFNTKVYSGMTEIALKFYKKNEKGVWVKEVPEKIRITPRILAYWYMENGTKKEGTRAYILRTDSYTKKGLEILREELNKNWGIKVNYLRTEKGNLSLYIPEKYGKIFEGIIKEYVIESMKRKLHSESGK